MLGPLPSSSEYREPALDTLFDTLIMLGAILDIDFVLACVPPVCCCKNCSGIRGLGGIFSTLVRSLLLALNMLVLRERLPLEELFHFNMLFRTLFRGFSGGGVGDDFPEVDGVGESFPFAEVPAEKVVLTGGRARLVGLG